MKKLIPILLLLSADSFAAVADHVVGDLVAFSQAVQAGLLNSRDMDEHVLAAGVRRDEAVTLRRVEKFHCRARPDRLPPGCAASAAISVGVPFPF